MHFVHPGGWYELLGQWQVECLDVLFEEEPEMAAYVVGMGLLEQQGGTLVGGPPPGIQKASNGSSAGSHLNLNMCMSQNLWT